MLRIIFQNILPGMLLTACAVWVCTESTQAQTKAVAGSKQMYSNRPIGFSVPTPYYGTPMAPRFIVPPVVPTRVLTARADAPESGPAPLVAVDTTAPQQILKEMTIVLRDPPPEVSVDDELDAFYARLAKIQLEKHQLVEALVLMQKIKSETFKVRTVVNLAEFVSRDKNYRSEAEQLYRLALAGMEALDKKEPFRIDTDNVKDTAVPPPPPPKPNPAPVISDPEPVAPPKIDQDRRQPMELPDDDPPDDPNTSARDGTGKLPPPPPPAEDVNDVVVIPPPGSRQSEVVAPPANTQQDNGLIPPTPQNPTTPDKEPPPASSTETKVTPPDTIVRPRASISLDEEDEPEKVVPKPAESKVETSTPTQQLPREPRRSRPVPVVLPEEN